MLRENLVMPPLKATLIATALLSLAPAQQHATLTTEDGAQIQADVYGTAMRGIVLAHGGRFQKESWSKQAKALESAGFRSIAIDFRGEGNSHGPGESDLYTAPLYADVIAAVHYLQKTGAKTVSLIGASFGGDAVALADFGARAQFEAYVDQKMSKFKADRYSGFFGGAKWLKDKLMGMPSEVNALLKMSASPTL